MIGRYELFTGNYAGGRFRRFWFRFRALRAFEASREPEAILRRLHWRGAGSDLVARRRPPGPTVVDIKTGRFLGYATPPRGGPPPPRPAYGVTLEDGARRREFPHCWFVPTEPKHPS